MKLWRRGYRVASDGEGDGGGRIDAVVIGAAIGVAAHTNEWGMCAL